jgi:Ni,Fe-hydrogenase III small subunit
MPERFRGYPVVSSLAKAAIAAAGSAACPYGALTSEDGGTLDMGKCLFCADCPAGNIEFSAGYQLAATTRDDLLAHPGSEHHTVKQLSAELLRMFGRSLKFREVSAGGCNACEADTNVLSTIGWDLGRFGIQFVASPRHADGLWVTGPVSENMREAMLTTYEAIPAPKIVVACGACAISGGPYRDHKEVHNGVDAFLPVDLYVPGCPPHPLTILDGLLRLIGRVG